MAHLKPRDLILPATSFYRPGDRPIPGRSYKLIEPLGRGNFGEVWSAEGSGVEVALKIVKDLRRDFGGKELNALNILRNAKHPNIVSLHGYWVLDKEGFEIEDVSDLKLTQTISSTLNVASPDQLIYVMDLAEGSMKDMLDAEVGGIDPKQLLGFLRDSARAIDYLNTTHGLQHRDIKPGNILLRGGVAQVGDFSLVGMVDSLRTSSSRGTPGYSAPEVARGEVAQSSDQFSLAITFCEMRTGRLPYEQLTEECVYHAKQTGNLWLEGIPEAEAEVVARAVSPEPEDRYETCVEFVEELADVLGKERISESPRPSIMSQATKVAGGINKTVLDDVGKTTVTSSTRRSKKIKKSKTKQPARSAESSRGVEPSPPSRSSARLWAVLLLGIVAISFAAYTQRDALWRGYQAFLSDEARKPDNVAPEADRDEVDQPDESITPEDTSTPDDTTPDVNQTNSGTPSPTEVDDATTDDPSTDEQDDSTEIQISDASTDTPATDPDGGAGNDAEEAGPNTDASIKIAYLQGVSAIVARLHPDLDSDAESVRTALEPQLAHLAEIDVPQDYSDVARHARLLYAWSLARIGGENWSDVDSTLKQIDPHWSDAGYPDETRRLHALLELIADIENEEQAAPEDVDRTVGLLRKVGEFNAMPTGDEREWAPGAPDTQRLTGFVDSVREALANNLEAHERVTTLAGSLLALDDADWETHRILTDAHLVAEKLDSAREHLNSLGPDVPAELAKRRRILSELLSAQPDFPTIDRDLASLDLPLTVEKLLTSRRARIETRLKENRQESIRRDLLATAFAAEVDYQRMAQLLDSFDLDSEPAPGLFEFMRAEALLRESTSPEKLPQLSVDMIPAGKEKDYCRYVLALVMADQNKQVAVIEQLEQIAPEAFGINKDRRSKATDLLVNSVQTFKQPVETARQIMRGPLGSLRPVDLAYRAMAKVMELDPDRIQDNETKVLYAFSAWHAGQTELAIRLTRELTSTFDTSTMTLEQTSLLYQLGRASLNQEQ